MNTEDTDLTILKVLNNNAIVAEMGGDFVVATGNGIGFQRSSGDVVSRSLAQHIFISHDDNSVGLHSSHEERIFAQILVIIEENFEITIELTPEVKRFHAHIMYLLSRINTEQQLNDRATNIEKSIKEAYPRSSELALVIGKFLSSHLGVILTRAELMYLAIHISRIVATSTTSTTSTTSQ